MHKEAWESQVCQNRGVQISINYFRQIYSYEFERFSNNGAYMFMC